jgi:PAS domain S-box-containing protein
VTRPGAGSRRDLKLGSDRTAPGAIAKPSRTAGEPRPGARLDRIDRERAFVVLRSAQRALLHAEDEAELLDLICRIAVDEAGYRLAWVGLAQDDPERTVRPVAQAGYEAGYLDSITITSADTPQGHGPTGTAIRMGRPVVGKSFLTDPELAPWRDDAIQHGFASSLALPLCADDGPFGALSIYATTPNAFSAEDVELLAGLADDLAFGITMLRTRVARGAAEERLRRSERNLAEAQRIAHIGSWEWDLATDTAVRSAETYRIAGVAPGAFLGTNEGFLAYVHPDDRARVQASERAAISGGARYELDYRIVQPDGAIRIVHEQGELIRDPAGTPLRFVGTVQDITERVQFEAREVRHARERAVIADALAALRPLDTPEQTAAAICGRIVELPEVAMSSLVLIEPDGSALPLAMKVDDGRVLARKSLGSKRSAQLRTRAAQGPWVEEWRRRPGHPYLADHLAIGLRGQAYAPVRSGTNLIGLLTVGSREPDAVALLTERLPAILEFASLAGALLAPSAAQAKVTAATRANIEAILRAGAFRPFFQPIVDLHTGAVVGYEALSRFTDGARPDVVFASAARAGLEVELEVATLEAALGAAAVLPPEAYLSLNASPALIGSGRLGSLLVGLTRQITLEITEHAVVEDYAVLRRDLAALGPTVSLAVDDAGAGYASLRHVIELAPSIVKLDIGLVRGINVDPARQALIAGMSYFAVKRKMRLVAEGIETAAELKTLRSLGIHHGQGYLLGRPRDGRGPGPWPTSIIVPAS